MHEVFSPIPVEARHDGREAYRQFLAARDGTLDIERRTLSQREARMRRYAERGGRAIDRALFDAQYARYDASRPTSPETLLLLSLVKVNAAESFGVGQTLEAALAHAEKTGDDIELIVLIEEIYHTKILLSAANLYGIEVDAPYTPSAGVRALVGSIAKAPASIARPLTLAGEIMGVATFLGLLETAGRVLDGEVRDAFEERICEVLIDEIGHVALLRLSMGSFGLVQTRALLPFVALGVGNALPELATLGVAMNPRRFQMDRMPEAVRKNAFYQ
jgi:hypothetical protein